MEIIEIPSKNSAFRPYRQSQTVGHDVKGSYEGSTMVDNTMELSGSSTAELLNGFKLPPWVGGNYKRVRTKLVKKVSGFESKKRDSSFCLKMEDGEHGEETMVKTRNLKNEKNKQQATEDAGNCTIGEVALNISVPIKTIRLFGQDYHYVCHDATNAGGGSGNSGGGGQNTAMEEGSQKAGQT